MVVFSLVTIGVRHSPVDATLGKVVCSRTATHGRSLWQVASLAAAFPNIVAIPLVASCVPSAANEEIEWDYGESDIGACACGSAIVFVGSFAWTAIFFTYGAHRLRTIRGRRAAPAASPRKLLEAVYASPSMLL